MSEDDHAEECTGESRTAFAGRCKSCGELYESYLDHLEECEALNEK
jgi:uncharacterized protein (DUF983 family)